MEKNKNFSIVIGVVTLFLLTAAVQTTAEDVAAQPAGPEAQTPAEDQPQPGTEQDMNPEQQGAEQPAVAQPPAPAPEPQMSEPQPEAEQVGIEPSVDIPPPSEEEINNGVKVTREKISLDLKGIDVIELVRILSMKMDKTIVPTKSVSGRVNIFLNNLTFDDALDVILVSQDLACEKKGNIINIMTSSEYERLYGRKYNEKREFKTIKLKYAKPQTVFTALGQLKSDVGKVIVDEASGTIFLIDIPEKITLLEETVKDMDASPQTEIFDIKYAKTADVKTQLTTAITSGPGELYVDDRSSKVVVSDLPEKMKKIKRMVKAFDEETRQVFIEAEIVQITLKDEFQRGIDWQKVFSGKRWDDLNLKGTFPVASSFTPSPLLTADFLRMTVGTLGIEKYTLTLNLLESYGDTKILSRPRIAVINNTEAKILVGAREAYITQSQSQAETTTVTAESVEFIDVGVKLNVVPTINSDGYITMKLKPEISSVRETLTTSLGSKVPIVETSEAETTVKVKDGEMIMIAGLIKDDKRKDVAGLPLLSRIPVFGTLFGTKSTLKKRTELVIFLKPRLISGAGPIPGAEMDKVIPPDILPMDMKRSLAEAVISRKLQEIRVEGDKDGPQTIEEVAPVKIKPGKDGPVISEEQLRQVEIDKTLGVQNGMKEVITPSDNKMPDIQNKMKGLKEY